MRTPPIRQVLRLSLSMLLMLWPVRGQAEEVGSPLLLPEVMESIRRAYPLIVAALADRRAAEGELQAARGGFDPMLRAKGDASPFGNYRIGRFDLLIEQPTPLWGASAFAGYRVSVGDFPDYDGKLVTNQYGEIRAGVAVPLLRNGPIDRRRASLRRAKASVQVADSSLGEARLAALRTGGSRYIDWVGAGLRRQVAQSLFDLAKVRDEGLQVRVQRGDIPAIERIDNQRALWQRQGLQVAAQRSVEQAALELSLFLRDEQGSPVLVRDSRLPPQLPRPERTNFGDPAQVQADQKIAQEQRPELRKLAQQRRQLEIERDLAKNQLWPSADLSASVSQDFGPPGYPRDKTVLDLSLSLDIPTLNRAARGRLAQAEAALQRFVALQRLVVDRINLEVADVHSQLAQAIRRVELAERELDLAQQVESAERAKFELGDSTLLNVNLREQATFDAALRRIDALVELHRAKIIHQAVLGNEG